MRLFIRMSIVLAIMGAVVFYVLTIPETIDAAALPSHAGEVKNGKYIFHAGGCASCHAAPPADKCSDPSTRDKRKLAGGRCLITPFGTFYVPNISPHKRDGIGGWTVAQFVTAMMRGVSPSGQHYYPAFPYTSYQRMAYEDVIDLKAYLDTLEAVASKVPDHDLALPFRLRRGLGLWKQLFLDGKQFAAAPNKTDEINRGAYLVEGPGHCGECHSPRDALGGIVHEAKYSGGPAPEGKDTVPNITPHKDGIGDWTHADIYDALTSGMTPSFDVLGGAMTKVQENMAKLTDADRRAIAAYLKVLPAIPSPKTRKAGKKQN